LRAWLLASVGLVAFPSVEAEFKACFANDERKAQGADVAERAIRAATV